MPSLGKTSVTPVSFKFGSARLSLSKGSTIGSVGIVGSGLTIGKVLLGSIGSGIGSYGAGGGDGGGGDGEGVTSGD